MIQDIRIGIRALARRPVFSAVAILTLALGIGATTAIFAVVNALLLRPLPYSDPERLVMVFESNLPRSRQRNVVSPANFLAWSDETKSFEHLAALSTSPVHLTGMEDP